MPPLEERPALLTIVTVYLAALAQGLTVVSFPASAALFKAQGFTDAEYGTLFLPQIGFTVLGSLTGPHLARRIGLGPALSTAFVASTLAAFLLYQSSVVTHALALPVLLAGTAAMGSGFGLSAAPLNALPARLFPNRADSALLGLHTVMGVGFSSGPLLAGELLHRKLWQALPLGLALLTIGMMIAARLALPGDGARQPASSPLVPGASPPFREPAFWAFVAAAVLYAFSEGTFSNWGILYLHDERHLAESLAGSALAVFWASLVAGRLLLSLLVTRFSSRTLWLTLPVLMISAFLAVAAAQSASQALLSFSVAGLACSGFFPLTVALASTRFPAHAPWISSMMIAALMFGVGIASFAIGPLRGALSLSGIYRLSAVYPTLALLIGVWFVRPVSAPTAASKGVAAPR